MILTIGGTLIFILAAGHAWGKGEKRRNPFSPCVHPRRGWRRRSGRGLLEKPTARAVYASAVASAFRAQFS